MTSGIRSVCIISVLLSACATEPSSDLNWMKAQWPIGDFEGYDPYPPGAPGSIHAFVQFGRDGLLRASLGCAQMGAPYIFSEDRVLLITNENGLSATSYQGLDCDTSLIENERALAHFLEDEPRIGRMRGDGLPLSRRGQRLFLQSVAHVLDDDTNFKVDD